MLVSLLEHHCTAVTVDRGGLRFKHKPYFNHEYRGEWKHLTNKYYIDHLLESWYLDCTTKTNPSISVHFKKVALWAMWLRQYFFRTAMGRQGQRCHGGMCRKGQRCPVSQKHTVGQAKQWCAPHFTKSLCMSFVLPHSSKEPKLGRPGFNSQFCLFNMESSFCKSLDQIPFSPCWAPSTILEGSLIYMQTGRPRG